MRAGGGLFSEWFLAFMKSFSWLKHSRIWLVYKPCQNRQTSASRVGHGAGSKRFDKEELGKRGSSSVVQLISSVESV